MKKILTVLMAAALVFAFAMPAAASDLKVSGSFYATGYYEDNNSLGATGPSHALVWQRLRMQPEWQIEEGLKVVARFDALDRRWGEADTSVAGSDDNVDFDLAWVDFNTGIGNFKVGYQSLGLWGTSFADNNWFGGKVAYSTAFGPLAVFVGWEKYTENDIVNPTQADSDKDYYSVAAIYQWEGGQFGATVKYTNDAVNSGATADPDTGYKEKSYLIAPYLKATFGPVAVEAEFNYLMGDVVKYELSSSTRVDQSLEGLSYYVKGTVNLGPAYVGAQYAYVQGDDQTTSDSEAGQNAGSGYNPFLILYSDDCTTWMGNRGTGNAATDYTDNILTNGYLYQVFGGVTPTEKLSIWAGFGGATADQATTANATYLNDDIGYEFDVTATYKIYDNLSYMIGFGYLWTGDWWKVDDADAKVDDDYVLLHKLSVTF